MKLIFHNIEQMTEHYLDELEMADKREYQKLVGEAEEELMDYHLRLKEFLAGQDEENAKGWTERFNGLISEFAGEAESLMDKYPEFKVNICRDELHL